jgi:hypothetical protein
MSIKTPCLSKFQKHGVFEVKTAMATIRVCGVCMNKIVDSYRGEDGDCYHKGCDDCMKMIRSGYGNAGCYPHKLEKKVEVLTAENTRFRTALEEIASEHPNPGSSGSSDYLSDIDLLEHWSYLAETALEAKSQK